MTNLADYEQFRKEVTNCTACPLSETRHTVVVDRGSPDAPLAFIGEAPGQNEDETGEAFVGRAGQELDRYLAEAGILAGQYVIFNVLKCRPPNNKFPGDPESHLTTDCVKACLPWFDRQFSLISPKVVILVGRKALDWTIFREKRPSPSMNEAAHKWYQAEKYPGVDFLVMYHTSFILRTKNQDPDKYSEIDAITKVTLQRAVGLLAGSRPRIDPTIVKPMVAMPKKRPEQSLFDGL